MLILLISVTLALSLSAMCSLFEAVLYSVPVGHVESMAASGRPTGRVLKALRGEVDRPIAAILSLNTIANTAGAAVAGAAAAAVLGPRWLPVFLAALTLAILLFAEIIPKTAGVVYSRPLSGIIAWPLQVLVWTFTPLVWLSRFATRLVTRGRQDPGISEEELIVMARLGLQSGTIQADEMAVIENILKLGERTAAQVMTPRSVMFGLPSGTTAGKARDDPRILTHSRLPVYDRTPDDIVGLVLRRDLISAVADDRPETPVERLMSDVHFVAESARLDRLLRTFLEKRQHLMVVLGDQGGVAGIVTLEDVLEEILGQEILDESDEVSDLRQVAHQRRAEILKEQGA